MSNNVYDQGSFSLYHGSDGTIAVGTSNIANFGKGQFTVGNSLALAGALTSSNSLTLKAASNVVPYQITYPATAPTFPTSIMTYTSNGVASFAQSAVGNVYNMGTALTNAAIYTAQGVTASGKCVFNITSTGTSSGNAVFSNIYSVSALAISSGTAISTIVLTAGYSISSDKKTVTVSCVTSTGILVLGGNTLSLAPDGIQVLLTVVGV